MPAIMVKDYSWRQSPENVIIETRLVGHPKKIDLFAVDNYVKASYPPFIFELFLWASIVEEASECIIVEKSVVFTLKKQEIGVEWPSLVTEGLDREKKYAQRSRALEIARVSAEEKAKARSEKRQGLERQAVRAQIELDTQTLNKITDLRDSHRREAMAEFEDWRKRAEKPFLENIPGTIQENRKAFRPPLKWFTNDGPKAIELEKQTSEISCTVSEVSEEPQASDKNIENIHFDDISRCKTDTEINEDLKPIEKSSSSEDSSSSEEPIDDSSEAKNAGFPGHEEPDEELRRRIRRRNKLMGSANRGKEIVKRLLSGEKRAFLGKNDDGIFEANGAGIPRPRIAGTIDVTFTARHFPTPARESHHLEEQEWLEKQAEARRKSGFVTEDLRPEEQDPQWLKDKGDEFFKAGNYLAAISAYSHGIKLSDRMSSLYANRSAAHYAMANYRRCCEDCSRALELMVPKCEGNRDSRARCHARLGASLCKLSAPQHGIPELEAAMILAPENETIKRDLQVAKRYFEMKD